MPSGVHRSAGLLGAKNSASLRERRARPRLDQVELELAGTVLIGRAIAEKGDVTAVGRESRRGVVGLPLGGERGQRLRRQIEEVELRAVRRGQIAVAVLLEVQPIDDDRLGPRLCRFFRRSPAPLMEITSRAPSGDQA